MRLNIALLIVLVALGVTNPSKSQFVSHASEKYILPLLEDAGAIRFSRDSDILLASTIWVLADAALDEVTDHNDFLLFSLYTIDLSYLRIYGIKLSDLKVVGVANNFIVIERPSPAELKRLTK